MAAKRGKLVYEWGVRCSGSEMRSELSCQVGKMVYEWG